MQIIVAEHDKDHLVLLSAFSNEEAAELKEWQDRHEDAFPPGSPQAKALSFILAYRSRLPIPDPDRVNIIELEHFAEVDLNADVADVWKVLTDYEKFDLALAVFKDVEPTRENAKAIYKAYTALIVIEEKYPTVRQLLAKLMADALEASRLVE